MITNNTCSAGRLTSLVPAPPPPDKMTLASVSDVYMYVMLEKHYYYYGADYDMHKETQLVQHSTV